MSDTNGDMHVLALEAERETLRARIAELEAALAAARATNREWIAANAPGGWIDDLRKAAALAGTGDGGA